MTTSSEDVLMQVNNVRYQKKNGTLYIMNERLAWIMENKDTVSVSHHFADIKLQKISPDGKSKIQLQVVLFNGAASTFQFTHPAGQAEQIKERDSIKDLLQKLLPKFKRKVDKELEEKNRILTENPTLLKLYKELVIPKVITSDEFWEQHAPKYTKNMGSQKQDIGVSGAFLADIKPQTDGCNGLKYNLTADIIESIFKTYPAVKRKHFEYVPHKISESEFWTKFFQSHYFHRDRLHTGTKDLFTECAKSDDQEIKRDIAAGIKDPLIDITSFEDTELDEGFGAAPDSTITQQTGNLVHQNMIKRFNQHSFMVLKACQQKPNSMPSSSSTTTATINGHSNGIQHEDHGIKRKRILEKITYEDLENTDTEKTPGLNLTRIDRYLHGPLADSTDMDRYGSEMVPPEVIRRIGRAMQVPLGSSHQSSSALVSPPQAINVVGELTPGGALMKGFQHESLTSMTPPQIEADLKNLYLSLCELLRHFWACFPITTPALEQKVSVMHDTLHRFHAAKLKPFEDRVLRECSPLSHNITSHLNQVLNSAYHKYAVWQQRKIQSGYR